MKIMDLLDTDIESQYIPTAVLLKETNVIEIVICPVQMATTELNTNISSFYCICFSKIFVVFIIAILCVLFVVLKF
jgi:hypothetical protein